MKQQLSHIRELINSEINRLIVLRDNCLPGETKHSYRYSIRRLEAAIGEIKKAQEKLQNKS